MIKKIILIILILTIISGCKNPVDDTITVIYPDEYTHGSITAGDEIYICGYKDRVCPDDFSTQKPVCKVEDPDC